MGVMQTCPEPKRQRSTSGWTVDGVTGGSEVRDLSVVDNRGEQVGALQDLMLDLRAGRIAYGMVDLEHAPEWSERVIAVPWNAMLLDRDAEHFRINARRDWSFSVRDRIGKAADNSTRSLPPG